ncbi:MAG: rod shape-determining protein MreC [Gemmatimonadetes bacterium]|nr:rod shape-determining protein MreC [Gemmatimonadota bacterium]MYC91594.1 rod shape-determining protein MreC [Gemmatimonadota bacterium]MYG34292.1 rod shape-determining protein MreC [Gemmatimonadota bacterium]
MAGLSGSGNEGSRSQLLGAVGVVLLSLVTVYLPSAPQQAIAHVVRQSVLRPFTELHAFLAGMRARARDFEILRAQMDSAMGFVAAHATLAEENRQLREILLLGERPSVRYLPTAIMRAGTSGTGSVFRVAAGTGQGVGPFHAVVTDLGLLGQVQQVQRDYALAIDWSHPEFRVSAMTSDGQNHGIIEPVRGRFREQDRLVLSGVDFLAELEPGTEVLTSGRGGAFPRGVRIGWVAGVAETLAGWSRSYYITPSVYPGAVTYAAITLPVAADSVDSVTPEAPADPAAQGPP